LCVAAVNGTVPIVNDYFNTQVRPTPTAEVAGPLRSCCAPARTPSAGRGDTSLSTDRPSPAGVAEVGLELVPLPGGTFTFGTDDPIANDEDGERPARPESVEPFQISSTTVTNRMFAAFVSRTGYRTTAEREGWSFVFAGLLPDAFPATRGVAQAPWWRQVFGARWDQPEGPGSSIDDRLDHPVVHVSHADAEAFCRWSGTRLPNEREWEFAARGGLDGARYPWGDDLIVEGRHMCNIWQGDFPILNTLDDGWLGTAPARSFHPNGYGLYNMVGNVWEWCADPVDGIRPKPDDDAPFVIRGGSYLCHDSYCNRYRVSARSRNTRYSCTGNTGFRVAR